MADAAANRMSLTSPIARPDTLTNLAYGRIKALLVEGKLKHHAIYPASQLAELLGVSRTPVREALLQLAAEGYLNFVKGRGFSIREFNRRELEEFFEVRRLIEIFAVQRIVGTLSTDELSELRTILERMEEVVQSDMDEFIRCDADFHMGLLLRVGNRFLFSVMENVRGLLSILGLKALAVVGRGEKVLTEHRAILGAIERGDKQAATRAMAEHLDSTEKVLMERFLIR